MSNFYILGKSQQKPLSGVISASPSKSHSLRGILFASLASGISTINNVLPSPDSDAMIRAGILLGAKISKTGNTLHIIGVAGKPQVPDDVIDAGNSGQVLRFIGAAAGVIDGYSVLTGDNSIRYNRPLGPLVDGLRQLGATCIHTKGDNYAPVIIKGPITPGEITISGEDSQPVSGLLIASALLPGITTIHVTNPGELPWINLTLSWLQRLQISYTHDSFSHYQVYGGKLFPGFEYTVPGDFSSLAYPVVAALITGSTITIDNVDNDDPQGDKKLLQILQEMGAVIKIQGNQLTIVGSETLQGQVIDVNDCIDAVPILAVLGCYAKGMTTLVNGAIARAKESDRLQTMTAELRKMGAAIEETEDGLIIQSSTLHGAEVTSYDDHRIAMSLAVAALGATGSTTVMNTHCVEKSYSNFAADLQTLGALLQVQS